MTEATRACNNAKNSIAKSIPDVSRLVRGIRFLVFLFLIYSIPVLAATSSNSNSNKIWTLPELTSLALTQNPATRLAWAQVQAAVANVGIVESTYWPQINFTAASSYQTGGNNNNSNNNSSGCSNNDPLCGTLTLDFIVWDFGVRNAQVKNADYLRIASQLSQNETIQTVLLQVEQAYYQLLGAVALVKADQISLKEAQINLNAANALHKQGLATVGDVYQAESTLSQAELALQQAQGNASIAHGQLAVSIGLPVQTPLKIRELSTQIDTNTMMKRIEGLLQQAKTQRPDLLAAEAQVQAAEAQVQVTKRQQWPTIALSANTQNSTLGNTASQQNRQSNVMLTLSVPIFTGFQQTNAIKQAIAQEQEAEATHDQLRNQVDIEVWQAYYSLETAQKTINTSKYYLKSSIQAANQTLGQYKAGVGNILSVLTTQTTEASARVQLIQSVLDWYLDLAQLMQAIGALEVPKA
ncbi:MAG: TolC family protein [Legionellales bacterium]|nr:TolC family protein [Legionellales bacterium]